MYALHLSEGTKSDIIEIKGVDPEAAALALVVLQEIKGDQDVLDSMTIHDYQDVLSGSGASYEVKHWWEQFKKGKNLWRLRVLESALLRYRIVYGYSQSEHSYYVLGLVKRDFNYESSHPISRRILGEYEELCC